MTKCACAGVVCVWGSNVWLIAMLSVLSQTSCVHVKSNKEEHHHKRRQKGVGEAPQKGTTQETESRYEPGARAG